jgi:hypothetical protein
LSGRDEVAGPSLNSAAIAASLNRHQVRYVIIGAFAAGSPKDLRVLPLLYRHLSARRAEHEAEGG